MYSLPYMPHTYILYISVEKPSAGLKIKAQTDMTCETQIVALLSAMHVLSSMRKVIYS